MIALRLRRAGHGKRRPSIGETGSATLEAIVLAPALVAIVAFAIAAGRLAVASSAIDAAARDAVRQASISRTPDQARTAALSSAMAALAEEGLTCTPRVSIDVSGLSRPVGTTATVGADVTCDVALNDLGLPMLPATVTLRSHALSPIDPLRGVP